MTESISPAGAPELMSLVLEASPMVFVGGPFTALMDPTSGVIPDEAKSRYVRLMDFFAVSGFQVENAHRREGWGQKLMSPEECTPLDFDALRRAALFVAYPGFPISPGTMVEIGWMSGMGKPMVLLVEKGQVLPALVAGLHVIAPVRYIEVADGEFDARLLRAAVGELLGYTEVSGRRSGAMSWDVSFDMLLRARLPFLGPDEVLSPDADLVDLGLDSMAMVELLTALEETYDVTMPEETLNIATFRTPASVWSALCSALGVTGGPC